ncbi:MAG: DUF4232 domain-containing protein [Acidimicrobiales bacterium]
MIPRRLLALLVAAVVLAGAGIAVALTRDDSTETATPAPTTTVTEPTVTTSTTEPPTTTTVGITTSTSPSSGTSTPTTVRRTTTTAAPRGGTTTRPPAPTTTTTPAGVPACSPAQIEGSVATNKPRYALGEEVRATGTLRNKSSAPCTYNGYTFSNAFKDQAGTTLVGQSVIADTFANVTLRPGETITQSASWNQRVCADSGCGPAPPNPYYAAVTWRMAEYTYEFSTSFILG